MPNETLKDVYIAYKDVVYKLSRHDGSVLWTFALKQAYEPEHVIGGYLQLAVVNGVVYAALEYRVYALSGSSGKEIWQYSQHLTSAELEQDRGRIWTMIIDKNLMYLQLTHGDMVALDRHDGSLQWSHLSFPNGGLFSPSGDTLYVSEYSMIKNATILHAIDGKTGEERWHFEHQLINISRSVTFVFDGIVYGCGNPLYALDARTGKQLWEQRLPDGQIYFAGLQIHNGVIYVNTGAVIALAGAQEIPPDFFRIFAFDAQTGEQLWESQPGYRYCSRVIDDGKSILVKTVVQKEEGLQALDAKTGMPRWQITLGELADNPGPYFSQTEIAIFESHLYVLTRKRPYVLQVFDVQTGKLLGRYPIALAVQEQFDLSVWGHDALYLRFFAHEGDPYISGSSTSFIHYVIYSIHLADGATNWSYDLGSLIYVQEPITGLLLAP